MPSPTSPTVVGERIANGLARHGFAVVPGYLSPQSVSALRGEGERRQAVGEFSGAHIGRAARSQHDGAVRGDTTCWLATDTCSAPEHALLGQLDALGVLLNGALMLGIHEVEAHYARYAPGTRYARHLDRFRDDDARVISLVLYLNQDWHDADGGTLRLFGRRDTQERDRDLAPRGGTLVAMRSEVIEHEVLPALVERWSIAAWMRRRPRYFEA